MIPRLPLVVSLYGFSTVGKSTLAALLADRRGYARLSAGHFAKEQLLALGLPRELAYENLPARDQPHPLLPLDPATGLHLTPRRHEYALFTRPSPAETAGLNRAAIVALAERGTPVVFEGYRLPEQHEMLRRLALSTSCLTVLVTSPQLPAPTATSIKDDLCVGLPFDARVVNDKDRSVEHAYAQLEAALGCGSASGQGMARG